MAYTPKMTIDKKTASKLALRKSAKSIQTGIIVIICLYLVMAVTLVRFIVGGAGIVLAKNDVFYGDIIPVSQQTETKERVLIDMRKGGHDGSLLDRAKTAFMWNGGSAIVEVHAGPTGQIEWAEPNIVVYDGVAVDGSMEAEEPTMSNPTGNPFGKKQFLYNEYLGVCQAGACGGKGNIVMFTRDQVIGIPVF